MRLMDVLIQQVERYGVMRAPDAAKAAFDAAIAEVTAPDYKTTRTSRQIAAAYNARHRKSVLRECWAGMTFDAPPANL